MDLLNIDDNQLKEIMKDLSPDEKAEVIKILEEYSRDGYSKSLQDLYDEDYEEIPVDIDTFIEDDRYIGSFTGNGELIYPFWRNKLREMFDIGDTYQEVALTGCLSGDTMIPLLNGRLVSIRDLSTSSNIDEYVYSFDLDTNRYVPGHLVRAFSTGIKDVYRITLDSGESFKATSNHRFMTRDKHWKSIDSGLSVGDSLMPCYRGEVKCGRGMYESIRHPQKDGSFIEEPTHRMVMRYKIGNFKGVVHHKDFDRYNNDPRNLLKSSWMSHRMYHAHKGSLNFKEYNRKYKDGELDEDTLRRVRDGARKGTISRWSNSDEHTKMSNRTSERMKNGLSKYMLDKRWSDPEQHKRVSKQLADSNRDDVKNNTRQISKAVKIANLAILEYGYLDANTYQETKMNYNMRSGYPSYYSIMNRISHDRLYELAINYNHKIVSIEYVGKEEVYDLTVEKYHNFVISSGIVAHNSIGTGKSTIACVAMSYILYKTMCLRNPQKYYRLAAGSVIVFAFFNNTLDLSTSVGYGTLQNIVQNSPWFLERGSVTGTKYKEYNPDKLIRFRIGSTAGHALGTNIICAMIDEVNFKQGANVRMEQSKIMETYNGVLERMGSRFMVNGKIAGKLFIVSSKKSEYDFLESYIKKKKNDPSVLVCDAKLWEVKPMGTYSGRTFLVAVGGSNMPSRIIPDDEVEYKILFEDGSEKIFRYNDLVTLKSGSTKHIQDIEAGDDIIA